VQVRQLQVQQDQIRVFVHFQGLAAAVDTDDFAALPLETVSDPPLGVHVALDDEYTPRLASHLYPRPETRHFP
jgi:hypothetical protein